MFIHALLSEDRAVSRKGQSQCFGEERARRPMRERE